MKDIPLREDIPRLYLEEKLSTTQIAEIVGISRGAVYSILKVRGVKFRTSSEGLTTKYPNGRYGELSANWRGGTSTNRGKCIDCGEPVAKYYASRCKECEGKNRNGKKNQNWRGGVTPINASIRSSKEYKQWRKTVFERDNYTCQLCGQHGGDLQADHIKPFAYHPELRFDIDNGRTLCLTCHRQTGTYGAGKKPRTKIYG